MFGADTPLVIDALQIAALATVTGAGGAWVVLRLRARRNARTIEDRKPGNLEERIRVLERLATDRPVDLDRQIEALREKKLETN